MVIHTTDAEAKAASEAATVDENELETVKGTIPPVDQLKDLTMIQLEFEKVTFYSVILILISLQDDDTNYHMDFIVACSNLRATNYDIELADHHKVSHTH